MEFAAIATFQAKGWRKMSWDPFALQTNNRIMHGLAKPVYFKVSLSDNFPEI